MQRKRKGDACFHSKSGCRWCPDSADNFNFPQEYCLRMRKLSILQYAFLCTSMHFYTFLCIFMYFYAFLCIFCCNSCTFVTIFFLSQFMYTFFWKFGNFFFPTLDMTCFAGFIINLTYISNMSHSAFLFATFDNVLQVFFYQS